MKMNFWLVSLLIYFMSMLKFVKISGHLLMKLLSLEGMMMSVMYFVVKGIVFGYMTIMGALVYLVVMVSEGALGLSLMVMLIRGIGVDKFYYLNLL